MLMGTPAPPNTLLADHVFHDIEDCVLRAKTDLAAIKSPQTEYEQDVAKVQSLLNDDWKRLYAAADPHERASIQNEIVQYGRDLQLLESKYKSGLELATSKYDQRTDAVVQKLCDKLVAALGPTRIRRTLRGFEPQYLVDYLPEDRAPIQLKNISSPSVVRKLEASPISPSTFQNHDEDDTTVAEPGPPNGMKRRTVDGPSSGRAAKRRATAENRKLLSRRRRRSKRKNGVEDEGHGQRIATENLTPGDVYLVWEQSEGWSAVLLLPTNDPNNDGVSATFENLGLPANPPVCYVFDRRSNTYKWRRGYEDGGPHVTKRFYPVMYLDDHSSPTRTTGWLAAAQFLAYDDKVARSLDSYAHIQEYLKRGAVLKEPANDDDQTIYVDGDTNPSTQRSEEIQDVNSSDPAALSLDSTRSPSASEPLPATRDTTVQDETEPASDGPSHSAKCNQTSRKSSPTPDSSGSREISMQVQADGQSLQKERGSGRSPSLDLATGESYVALSTQEQEQYEQHAAVQEKAACFPPTGTETEPAVAAQSAKDDSLENVSTDGNRLPRLDCQTGGYPSVATAGHLVPSAPAGDASHDIVPRPPFSSSLQTRSSELVVTDPRPSESNDAERSSSEAPANGSRGPFVTSLDTQGRHKGTLPTSETQPCRPARTPPGTSHPDVIRNPSQPGLSMPQSILSHFPPPFADASGRQPPAMRQVLPPILTAEEMWSASPLGAKTPVRGRTLGAGSDAPVAATTGPFSGWYPRQSMSAAAPSLDTRVATPRTFQSPACNLV
ncbi:hypothetical protein Purlil1_12920 [Purpureocillium lilacinum]|uniref:Uncharacterized protein n=1 Tax=Purpureocillium lilacinum TaxID=33203 RepID=A0ABR0BFS6_PURLI|nr:hypothetical protein Purlil1_12920 [Purpureocillium lilacinum]